MSDRPTGVTVLGILSIIIGALILIGGIMLFALGPAFQSAMMSRSMGPSIVHVFGALGAIDIVFGAVFILIGYGLLNGMSWSWWLTVIFSAIGIVINIVSILGTFPALIGPTAPLGAAIIIFPLLGAVINGVILYYFLQPHVKYYFGLE